MKSKCLSAALGALALGGACFAEADATDASLPNLRGFGRVKVESFSHKEQNVSTLSFQCEDAQKAETVAGKFLMDLYAEDGATFKDGIHETPGGAAFAVERDGKRTVIYAAENRVALDDFISRKERKERKENLVASAAVPEWMKAFGWGLYGMGGLENHHQWMNRAKEKSGIDPKTDTSLLDPREDYEFLREMGGIHFDNWLETDSWHDNADGLVNHGFYWREKLAHDYGIPMGCRFYLPCGATGGFSWYGGRRFAQHMDKPPKWLQSGWLRYYLHFPHNSWYDKDIWGYNAARAKAFMERAMASGKVRNWMHPAGETNHRSWYDWHADYSETAQRSFSDYLQKRGVSLGDAAAMFNRPERPFRSWDEVPIPEFATFAGLSGMVLDLYGTWQTKGDGDWQELPDFPGNWDFLSLYVEKGKKPDGTHEDGRHPAQKERKRLFRRTFAWESNLGQKRIYLYFFPMSGATLRHEISLNGGKTHVVGNWCAIDVTDELREGDNTLDILLQGSIWNGRVFLSTEKPEVYPNMAEARCRLWTLWHEWRRDEKADRCEEILDAMRQADPNAPIEIMAPAGLGMRNINRLFHDYGCFSQFTGEGVWFFPWWKRYAKLYGYQGTSELAGPYNDVAGARRSALRVFLAGLDMHKPVFLTQTYSRNPEVRQWWLKHKNLFARMGKYDIDLKQPQVLIYRRFDLLGGAEFPEPFPAVDESVRAPRSPWNYDLGRGSLQSIGQSFLYIDDDGIEDGKMDGFKVMIDCGNEIIPEDEVARITSWVENGGVFIAYPFTGRSTPLKAATWPMTALTGSKIKDNAVRPGYVPKVVFPDDTKFFPSFAGQTIHGAKRRIYQNDFALEIVAEDAKPILLWEDGRIAATARRVGKGMVVHLGSFFWRGSEDVQGMWNPQDEVERSFLRDLLAAAGLPKALVETDDRLVLVQPYRSKNGLDLVAVLCNFNEEGEDFAAKNAKDAKKETVVRLRCGRKPRRIVGYAGVNLFSHKEQETTFEWNEAEGVATVKIALPPQEVAILNAECYGVDDALAHWWAESKEQWHELKKPVRDFSKYTQGKWKDPTQDLKEGWNVGELREIPLDCLQFWGWAEGKGAVATRRFDLDEPGWLSDGGATRLVFAAKFLSSATIRLNGKVLADKTDASYLDFEVSSLLAATGNELVVEFADGEKFIGLDGAIYLYHREKPFASVDVLKEEGKTKLLRGEDGKDAIEVYVPAKWQGEYRVRLYMEGTKNVPKGVRVRDRFMRKHHHNYGSITDIDITDLLRFGETNRIDIGANSAAEQPDKTSVKPLSILRLDLYKEAK